MERQIDGVRPGSSTVCEDGEQVHGRLRGKTPVIVLAAHPLIFVGVFEPEIVGERSHGDGQLADLFQLYRPLMSAHDERIHPPICGLKARQEGLF